jgi:hypothetical protein
MPRCIVKQPNGLYAIWSTIVDHFVSVECTAEEALAEEVADKINDNYPGGADALRRDLCRELENIHASGKAWKWAPDWTEAIETIRELHGEDAVTELLGMIDTHHSTDSPPR